MKRLTRPTVKVDETAAQYMVAQGCIPTDLRSMNDRLLDLVINGPTLNGVNKDVLRQLIRQLYAELKRYEDTGLEPEEVNHCKLALMGKSLAEITEFDGISIERLKELAIAEKAGRLVVLPCAPDATYWEMHGNIPAVSRFDGMCTIDENLDVLFYKNEGDIVRATDIGKTVFLTREEAEGALEGGGTL